MDYAIGLLLAAAVCGATTLVGMDRDRALYPAMLMVVASYWVLFAVMGDGNRVLLLEIGLASAFVAAALAGFRLNLWLVAGGLAAHGIFDLTHDLFFTNRGVPVWWPGFCSAFDVFAAIYLSALLMKRSSAEMPRDAAGVR